LLIGALAEPGLEQARLTIVGDGPQRQALKRQAESLGLKERVVFAGLAAPEAIPGLLAEANAFVLASVFEGRPNVVLEAMAAGLPVVASRIDGVTELVEDNVTGLLFEAGDLAGLAKRLRRLAEDEALRRRLGAAGRQSIVDRGLTWERTAEAYLRLFRDVLNPH